MTDIPTFDEYFTSHTQLEEEWDFQLNPLEPGEIVVFGKVGGWPYLDGNHIDVTPLLEEVVWQESELKLSSSDGKNSILVYVRGVTEWWMAHPPKIAAKYPNFEIAFFPRRAKFLKRQKVLVKIEIEKAVRFYSRAGFPDVERDRLTEEAKSFIRKTYREWPWETELKCRESYTYEGDETICTLQWYFSPLLETHPKCI